MRILTLGVVATLAIANPGRALGQHSSSKLAIGTISGDSSRVRRQLLVQLCGPYECVAPTKLTTESRPDPAKLARAGVAGYLGGAVTGEPGARRLVLTLTTPASTAHKPARTWHYHLAPDGSLKSPNLERFSIELDEALQAGEAHPPPAPVAPPQAPTPAPPSAKAPPPPPPPPPAPAPAAPAPAAAAPAPKPAPAPAAASEKPAAEMPLRFAAEGGLWVTNRKLSYSGATTPPGATGLRTFDGSSIFVPLLRLEVYPGALAGAKPLWAGLGLYFDYGHSVGLKVEPPSGSTEGSHDASLSVLDAGLLWRLRPVSGSRFTVAPAVGYRALQQVTSAKNGVTIGGLPDTNLSGYEVRVDLDAPLSGHVSLQAGGGYTFWTSAKDLVGDGFFGKGSARGLEVEGGAAFRLTRVLTIRALVEYQSTSYSSLADPAPSLGSAAGATDAYLGARAMLRGEF